MQANRLIYESIRDGRLSKYSRIKAALISIVGVTMVGYQLYAAWFSGIDPYAANIFVVVCVTLLAFLLFPLGRKSWRDKPNWFSVIDAAVVILLLVYIVYIMADYDGFQERFGNPSVIDLAFGSFMIIAVLEMGRRTLGMVLSVICVIAIIMNLFAPYMPRPFFGSPLSWSRIVEITAMQDFGIYGSITTLLASYLILFFFFTTFLQACGGSRLFLGVAMAVAGRFRGGPAKVAVIGSAMLGTMVGAPVANVVGTGSVTIPLMKKTGYTPEFAGAVESCASTGAMVVPPIMGTAAFIIAQMLEIPYLSVMIAAMVPAFLYYLGVFSAVHLEAVKRDLKGLPKESLPSIRKAFLQSWPVLVPIVLLFFLLTRGYSLASSALWATVAVAALTMLRKETRWNARTLMSVVEDTAKMTVTAGGCIIVAGILLGNFWVSGLGSTLARLIYTASGGSLLVGVMIAAVVCAILGMGMGAPAVYLTVLVFGIPALIQLGLDPLPAHFFAFYWGMLAALTPPVCMAVYAAMAIAGSKLWPTALLACRIGITAYLVSFAFVFRPALLAQGTITEILLALVPAAAGVVVLQIGMTGHLVGRLGWWTRAPLIAGGLALWAPQTTIWVGAAAVVAVILFVSVLMGRRLRKVPVSYEGAA